MEHDNAAEQLEDDLNTFTDSAAAESDWRWKKIAELTMLSGLELYDIELPGRKRGVLRVFVTGPNGSGVGVGDCAKLSKRIIDLPDAEELMPGETLLEVSSPGINRRLRRTEHFARAVGERVKITVEKQHSDSPIIGTETILVKLTNFNPGPPASITCEVVPDRAAKRSAKREGKDAPAAEIRQFNIDQVRLARVDFEF